MIGSSAEVRAQSQSRAAVYGFLAWLFLKLPDVDFVARLLANDVQDSLQLFSSDSESASRMIDGLNGMRLSLVDGVPGTLEDMCLALAVEHTRFLRGVGRAYGPPPPYESLYRSSEAGEDNSFLLQLTEFYHHAQAAILSESAERVDYLGIELDLMRLLCDEESRATGRGDTIQAAHFSRLQQHFLHEHLLAWAPRYCESFISQTAAGFYRGVVQLVLGFLEAEAAMGDRHSDDSQVLKDSTGQVFEE